MSETKFTKGPWEVDGDWFISDYNGTYVARTEKMDKEEERAANSALIAAAPEMYDALKEACYEMCVRCSGEELCKPCSSLSDDGLHCNAEPGKCFVQRWLNVLAKARGEEKP